MNTLFFRMGCAQPQLSIDGIEIEEARRVGPLLATLVDCGCCLPAFRGSDGTKEGYYVPGEVCTECRGDSRFCHCHRPR